MKLEMLTDEISRLHLPHPPGPRPVLPPAPRAEASEGLRLGLRFASRRGILSILGGSSLGSLPEPPRAQHRDPILTLVHRITQGFNINEYERARALGYEAYLEEQLNPESIDDSEVETRLQGHFPTLFMSPKQLFDTYSTEFSEPYFQFKGAMLLRSVNSKRQLFERMCEFWSDHFNIDHDKGNLEWAFLPEHDLTVIRPHAMGSFPAMLSASAFSAAMLYYLDNWLNVLGAPQENYARELLELHTLSVHGGYNEADVREVAKCFTGWTLNDKPNSPDWMRGVFDPRLHTGGPKFVLGNVIEEPLIGQPGQPLRSGDAQKVLDIAAAHPSTAAFLARKLIHWFLTPEPPQPLVDEVAQTYLDTQGDIKAMLRVILRRENMRWAAPIVRPKFRRPFHLMTTLFRTLDAIVRKPEDALSHLGTMGHTPYAFAFPTGYPDTVEAWGGLLLPRWTFVAYLFRPLFGNGIPGVNRIGVPALMTRIGFAGPSDGAGLAGRINAKLLGSVLADWEVTALQDFIDAYPVTLDERAVFDVLALAVSLPGFQSY